jgi:hypothetical protein
MLLLTPQKETNYVQHPKAIEAVAILGLEFRRSLKNTMEQ